jgi:hypothetical protein
MKKQSLFKALVACSVALLPAACIVISMPGLHSGYNKLSAEAKEKVVFTREDETVCNLKSEAKIHAVSAAQLRKCLNENDSSVVYIWSPDCHSSKCIPLGAAENYCKEHNMKIFIVAEYYDFDKTFTYNNAKTPIFSINHLHYKTDNCNKYRKLFTDELIAPAKLTRTNSHHRFLVFHKDKFVATRDGLF